MRQGHRQGQGQGQRNGSGRSGALCVGLLVITLAACSGGGGRRFFTVVDDGGAGDPGNDGGGQGAPDLASAGPDLAQLAYPSGPYGNQIGDVLADKTLSGYRLSLGQTDASQLQWDTNIRFGDFHDNAACKCLLITWGATWCGACQQEQPSLVASVQGDPGFCVLNILQEGPFNGTLATKQDVLKWNQRFRQNFYVVQGTAATEQLWNGYGMTIGLPFNFVVNPTTMTVLDTVQGFRPDIYSHSMALCGQ